MSVAFTTGITVEFKICFVDRPLKPGGSGVLYKLPSKSVAGPQPGPAQLSAQCLFSCQAASALKG